ncbi:hypothetical protein A3G67_00605 [Candidatus Roizmanbacteria bacterium RIFCSPLOWO2_12_FULL_40_12]|uniref:DUF304 domain-containing protein n=1 Tax=Candidatus Roizmanbacteria bacterium RIFCSPLOWO2_01_FULL_40_42 TaxID=1802066 RepID=A0A1F7J693_9BACT|nr:MAG: hypothetical protein A2779_02085 [Candidatus Roizmanbacteria bacterium RIFCSPHIGHO2_01_FULL_40_98]OGK28780.1 MAG: hypothetical protein A3C31_04005 [Candidatus Roizmanbacteria bacterium RIFCSPHIGHO2_02_FULL_40_53]OGK29638.1 MAG: hypothetical protein A2W49_00400 [Candidatus Roizmanbacteria bacterium RIFCSPHIGHO2_12_41_18]OGK36327.1 MAG: hypothetical protein A3E69_02780 [Candidatus Roizmanbacteria bacterium RIFCSPHIGHO2_12_FULL_40_130]OGK51121.1 MAG: hypothetical protein A3B50_04980 [Candi
MTKPKDLLTPELCQRFITLPGERLIIAKREHWFVMMGPLTTTGLLSLLFISLAALFFLAGASDPTLFIICLFLILVSTTSIVLKIIADWHYHLYVFTTKRILQVNCAPLFSHSINDVQLDQVRITEIDVRIKGFINELLDMGDVIIAFDRPSHEETFVIANIKDPSTTGILLANTVKLMMESAPIWFQPRTHEMDGSYKFAEDVESVPSVHESMSL